MPDMIYILEMIGVIAFAISGMIEARAKNMDPVGIYTIAFITALGGGTLRDLMLDNHPLYWMRHQEQPILIFFLTLAFSLIRRFRRLRVSAIVIPDAIGLGVFSILGAQLALQHGHIPVHCLSSGGDHRDFRRRPARYPVQRGAVHFPQGPDLRLGCLRRVLALFPV